MSRPTLQRATIAPDYPNFGEYQGDVYAMGDASTSMKAIWNNIRAVDVLTERPDVDAVRIGVIGHSLGGQTPSYGALRAADQGDRLVMRLQRLPRLLPGRYRRLVAQRLRAPDPHAVCLDLQQGPFRFSRADRGPGARAFFTNLPLHDTNFAIEGVCVCLAAARPVYGLLGDPDHLRGIFPDAGHAFPPSSHQAAFAFLDRSLSSNR